jgi:hypothetical protein
MNNEGSIDEFKNGNERKNGGNDNDNNGIDETYHVSTDTCTQSTGISDTGLLSVNSIPILPGHDVRIKLMTSNVLSFNDNLYQAVCPGGTHVYFCFVIVYRSFIPYYH